jgi:hypothetical protein
MHLGLTDGPFVPHNLISAQDSPLPLPKFQISPRLKILIFFGSKKGTQIYYPILSKKYQQANPLQVPQQGPYVERYPLTAHFYISLDISLYLKGPIKRASLHVSQKQGPYENRHPFHSLTAVTYSVHLLLYAEYEMGVLFYCISNPTSHTRDSGHVKHNTAIYV